MFNDLKFSAREDGTYTIECMEGGQLCHYLYVLDEDERGDKKPRCIYIDTSRTAPLAIDLVRGLVHFLAVRQRMMENAKN